MGFLIWIALAILAWVVIPCLQAKRQRAQVEGRTMHRLLDGISGMLAKMAKADGHVSREEVELARRFFQSMGLDEEQYRRAVENFNYAKDAPYDISHYAREFASVASNEARELVYEMLWAVAVADGRLDPAEDRLLHEVVGALGFHEEVYFYFRRVHLGDSAAGAGGGAYSSSHDNAELERAYARLGCSASDSDEAVRAAYRKQAMRYHPDRLRAEGLPEGMLAKATQSMAEINAAWDVVCLARGIK